MRTTVRFLSCVILALCVVWGFPVRADSAEQRAIDAAKSLAQFSIQHIFVDRVVGTVPILSGSVTIPAGSLIPISVSAVLDATRINSGDRDRDSSLESPDYFDTKNFPTWTFTGAKIAPAGPTGCVIDGMLTMHGVTQPEHFEVTVHGDSANPTYHAVGHINRHAFGMKGARLDPVIGDAADVTLDITLK